MLGEPERRSGREQVAPTELTRQAVRGGRVERSAITATPRRAKVLPHADLAGTSDSCSRRSAHASRPLCLTLSDGSLRRQPATGSPFETVEHGVDLAVFIGSALVAAVAVVLVVLVRLFVAKLLDPVMKGLKMGRDVDAEATR